MQLKFLQFFCNNFFATIFFTTILIAGDLSSYTRSSTLFLAMPKVSFFEFLAKPGPMQNFLAIPALQF